MKKATFKALKARVSSAVRNAGICGEVRTFDCTCIIDSRCTGCQWEPRTTCTNAHNHTYANRTCVCGHVYCYNCCASTNVHEGGKHEPDYMLCPACNHNYYEEDV